MLRCPTLTFHAFTYDFYDYDSLHFSSKNPKFCSLPVKDVFASLTDVDDSNTMEFTGGRLAR